MGLTESRESVRIGSQRSSFASRLSRLSLKSRLPRLNLNLALANGTNDVVPLSSSEHSEGFLLTPTRFQELQDSLPTLERLAEDWKLVYSPRMHGVSLRTLYRQTELHDGPSLIFIHDTTGRVFGGFAPEAWRPNGAGFYGDGSSFVFSFYPLEGNSASKCEIYYWGGAGTNDHFMFSNNDGFGMGGAHSGTASKAGDCAWHLHSDFIRGTSAACPTFENPASLAAAPEFVIGTFEIWIPGGANVAAETSSERQSIFGTIARQLRKRLTIAPRQSKDAEEREKEEE